MRPGASDGEIEEGINFDGRELYVEEERIWERGRRRGIRVGVLIERHRGHWHPAIHRGKIWVMCTWRTPMRLAPFYQYPHTGAHYLLWYSLLKA
jgi:hypothetical protein